MNIIVCLDNNNGMLFNKRRQSQDRLLRRNIQAFTNNKTLYMNNYSYNLYKDIDTGNIQVDEDFLNKGTKHNFYLVENVLLKKYENNIDLLIIYRWNRLYPSDLCFDININNNSWELFATEEFSGSSHEKITKETYRRIT